MLLANVVNVSSVSDEYYSKYFMLQVLHEQQGGAGKGGPRAQRSPHACRKRSEAAGVEHEAVSMGMAIGTEHEATSMDMRQARSTM
jgi:hypothetical protein